MPRERGQMCVRMTCRPDGPPAANPGAPFPSTSFSPIELTPAPTSQLLGGDHTRKRGSSGGNYPHISAVNLSLLKLSDRARGNDKSHQTHKLPLPLILPCRCTIPQSPTSCCRAGEEQGTAPQNHQDCHLGSGEQWGKSKTGRGEGERGNAGAQEAAEVGKGRDQSSARCHSL